MLIPNLDMSFVTIYSNPFLIIMQCSFRVTPGTVSVKVMIERVGGSSQ